MQKINRTNTVSKLRLKQMHKTNWNFNYIKYIIMLFVFDVLIFFKGLKLQLEDLRDEVLALYPKLRVLALSKTKNVSDAEDIVQHVMVKVWENPTKIIEAINSIGTTVELYLKRAVINRFIDLTRHNKRFSDDEDFADRLEESIGTDPTRRNLCIKIYAPQLQLVMIADSCLQSAAWGPTRRVSKNLNITQSTVNKRIAKCLKKLNESSKYF